MSPKWPELSTWWRKEIANDPSYESVVTPLLLEILRPREGGRYLDLGCGEGRIMRSMADLGASSWGIDANADIVVGVPGTIVTFLPTIPIRDQTVDGVFAVLTLEHIQDHRTLFVESARVTVPDGVMAVVMNHPFWTAPGSTPITDEDGEVLWRPGEYFSSGSSDMPAGHDTVTFHHRSLTDLLNSAADAGWSLENMIEQPHHEFEDQGGIPRLLGCRWRLLR